MYVYGILCIYIYMCVSARETVTNMQFSVVLKVHAPISAYSAAQMRQDVALVTLTSAKYKRAAISYLAEAHTNKHTYKLWYKWTISADSGGDGGGD